NSFTHLITSLRALGRDQEADEATGELAMLAAGDPGGLYDMACLHSLRVPRAGDADERGRYADEAMKALRAAVAVGWSNANHTANAPDLVPLHDRDDFRGLLAELFDRVFPAEPFVP